MKDYNKIEMKGRLYNHKLEVKDTDKGEAIAGDVILEVDENGTQAVGRFFAYPTYNNGKTNRTYGMLEDIMTGNTKNIVDDGDDADWLAFTGSVDISYFVPREGAKDIDELNRSQKIRGQFINANRNKEYKNHWKCDLLVTKVRDVEADPERGTPHFAEVTGYIVDSYNERVVQARFNAYSDAAINFILNIPASYDAPHFVSVAGGLLRTATKVVVKSAFGDDEVNETIRTNWSLTFMALEPYAFGDESVMSKEKYNEYRDNLDAFKREILEKKQDDGPGANLAF